MERESVISAGSFEVDEIGNVGIILSMNVILLIKTKNKPLYCME